MTQGIILAAGLGRRLSKITTKTPKALISINGKPILERNIEMMIEAGVEKIVLVAGYMHEKFAYLAPKYSNIDFQIVYNPDFETSNTISSLNTAKHFFENDCFIVTADNYLKENVYRKYHYNGCYYILRPYTSFNKPEWVAKLDSAQRIVDVDEHAKTGFAYTGISHWNAEGLDFIYHRLLSVDWSNQQQRNYYWDALLLDHLADICIKAIILENNSEIYEFDDLTDIELFSIKESLVVNGV